MSASEKLATLAETMGQWNEILRTLPAPETASYRILTALPQIVAVVGAAERTDIRQEVFTGGMRARRHRELRHALAALNEALESDADDS